MHWFFNDFILNIPSSTLREKEYQDDLCRYLEEHYPDDEYSE